MRAPVLKFPRGEPRRMPADGRSGWRIHFAPGPKLLRNGNDPLRILRELARLGAVESRVDAKWVPPLAELDPEECRLAWSIELTGDIDGGRDPRGVRMGRRRLREAGAVWRHVCVTPSASDADGHDAGAQVRMPPAPARPGQRRPPRRRPRAGRRRRLTAVALRAGGSFGRTGSIRVSTEKIDELMNSVGELVITQSVLNQLAAPLEGREAHELRSALAQLERHMRELQESVMRVRMLPISFVFNRFPRLMRDLGQRLGKKIELRISGEHTELDKTVLEKIGDPLVHLVRNSHRSRHRNARSAPGLRQIGHGVDHLHAYHKGGNVCVEVGDDGGGLIATASSPRRANAASSAWKKSSPTSGFTT